MSKMKHGMASAEHTQTDKSSHIFKHLEHSYSCNIQYTSLCFKILDSTNSVISPKLKEARRGKILTEVLNQKNSLQREWRFDRKPFNTVLSRSLAECYR